MNKGITVICSVTDNIGQVKKNDVDAEIKRLWDNGHGSYEINESEFMFNPDEAADNVSNPARLSEGYFWVVKSGEFIEDAIFVK